MRWRRKYQQRNGISVWRNQHQKARSAGGEMAYAMASAA